MSARHIGNAIDLNADVIGFDDEGFIAAKLFCRRTMQGTPVPAVVVGGEFEFGVPNTAVPSAENSRSFVGVYSENKLSVIRAIPGILKRRVGEPVKREIKIQAGPPPSP
jgi:hypothetical protein